MFKIILLCLPNNPEASI